MPKVTQEYIVEKKKKIVEATIEILHQHPLYEITMLDIIRQAGISKGGIYLYYNDIDQVIIDVVNYLSSQQTPYVLPQNDEKESIEVNILRLFESLGKYIDETPGDIFKIRFELMVYLGSHAEKTERIMSQLILQNVGDDFMKYLGHLVEKGVTMGEFRSNIPINLIMTNASVYIDGICDTIAMSVMQKRKTFNSALYLYFREYAFAMIQSMK